MKYRYFWSRIFNLQTFLVGRQLVILPLDDKDNYYHVPALEGTMTFFQLEILSQEGYENNHQLDIKDPRMWFRSIGARLLPHLEKSGNAFKVSILEILYLLSLG
jgi:hypothetical protein